MACSHAISLVGFVVLVACCVVATSSYVIAMIITLDLHVTCSHAISLVGFVVLVVC